MVEGSRVWLLEAHLLGNRDCFENVLQMQLLDLASLRG
jgi:hypothetical protein